MGQQRLLQQALMYLHDHHGGYAHPLKRDFHRERPDGHSAPPKPIISIRHGILRHQRIRGGSRAKIGKVVITENTEDDIPAQGENELSIT